MANFSGSTPQPIPRFGSQAQWDTKFMLPQGLASIVRNSRYRAESVRSRNGYDNRLKIEAGGRITGFNLVRYIAENTTADEFINLLAYSATTGKVYSAVPFVQASVTLLSDPAFIANANLPLVPNLFPSVAQAFNRGYIGMGNLATGVTTNLVYNPARAALDPCSDKPYGAPWQPGTLYRIGQLVVPSYFLDDGTGTGGGTWLPVATGTHTYRCTVAGTSGAAGAQPVWPTGLNATIPDNTITWEEMTAQAYSSLPDAPAPITPTTTPDVGSPIVDGATVFLVLTYNSTLGESTTDLTNPDGTLDTATVLQWVNTTGGPVDLSVILPPIPAVAGVGGPFGALQGASSYNVYAYIVPGVPNSIQYTDPTFYARVASTQAPGTVITLSAFPSGVVMPTVATATVAPAGNVDVGTRFMIVLFENLNGYITGCSNVTPVRVEITAAGFQVYCNPVPIGPYNTKRRICAFTVAGQSNTGPYFYIPVADIASPGFGQPNVQMSATTIEDNVTTSATFNFTDYYLPGAVDVTNYFDRQEVDPASDVYFSKQLSRVIYTGSKRWPSGFAVSDLDDPEAVRVPNSVIQCAESNGDRALCWRELRDIQIAIKEMGFYVVTPLGGDPNSWAVNPLATGSGPVGPKAVDFWIADDNEYLVFWSREGLRRCTGQQLPIVSRELDEVNERINWAAAQQIVVEIDGHKEEIHCSVPIDGSPTNNLDLVVNYHYGWDDPVIFSVRSGKLVPNVQGRKWSLDDRANAEMIYVPQRFVAGAAPGGADLANNLICSGYDGCLYTEGSTYHDTAADGVTPVGYFSQWWGVPTPRPKLGIVQLNGASLSAIGNGLLNVYVATTAEKTFMLTKPGRICRLTAAETERDLIAQFYSTSFAPGWDNGGVIDAWWEMHSFMLWTRNFANSRQA